MSLTYTVSFTNTKKLGKGGGIVTGPLDWGVTGHLQPDQPQSIRHNIFLSLKGLIYIHTNIYLLGPFWTARTKLVLSESFSNSESW